MLIEELFRMGANVIFLDTNLKTQEHSMSTKTRLPQNRSPLQFLENQLGEMESSVDYELTADEFCNLK